jgi:hypothetical protein
MISHIIQKLLCGAYSCAFSGAFSGEWWYGVQHASVRVTVIELLLVVNGVSTVTGTVTDGGSISLTGGGDGSAQVSDCGSGSGMTE